MHGMGGGLWLVFVLLPLLLLGLREEHETRRRFRVPRAGGNTPPEKSPGEAAVYRLARRLGGKLTVSDLIAESGASAATAESLLEGLVDGVRVRMEVTDSGVVIYEFHEFLHG